MASFSVSRGRAPRSTVGMYGERKTNARCPCTPPLTVETFGEEISTEACSGKEIAGLLTRKSGVSGFSRGKLEAGRNELGLCTVRYESKGCW